MICCGAGFGCVAIGLYNAQSQARRGVVLGAVQLLGKLQHEYVEPITFGAHRQSQRSRGFALAVARIDLNLADFK